MYPFPAPAVVMWGIPFIALSLSLLFVLAHRAAGRRLGLPESEVQQRTTKAMILIVVWLLSFAIAAGTGLLARFEARPPPLLVAMAAILSGTIFFSLTRAGKFLASGLSLSALVGFQAFRLPLEVVMHDAAVAGVMPPQMTYSGWNFDIITGVTAALRAAPQ